MKECLVIHHFNNPSVSALMRGILASYNMSSFLSFLPILYTIPRMGVVLYFSTAEVKSSHHTVFLSRAVCSVNTEVV